MKKKLRLVGAEEKLKEPSIVYVGAAPKPKAKPRIPAKRLAGVESPVTVSLHPLALNPEECVSWWSHDGILMGGILINGDDLEVTPRISYLPTPIPRSWAGDDPHLVIEYEGDCEEAKFGMRLHYGCGHPSELHLVTTDILQATSNQKRRLRFPLNKDHLYVNELFRASVEVVRETTHPVLIYGVWLEVGV